MEYSAGLDTDGRFVLEGTETWYYPDGRREWTCEYQSGRPVGTESFYRRDGSIKWRKEHSGEEYTWTLFRPDGSVKSFSRWLGRKLLEYELAGGGHIVTD